MKLSQDCCAIFSDVAAVNAAYRRDLITLVWVASLAGPILIVPISHRPSLQSLTDPDVDVMRVWRYADR